MGYAKRTHMSIHDPHEFIKYKLSADTHVRDGRNLYEHLCNVEKILKICGCDDSVCLAGLFHSVYGTSKWRHESIRDRELVRSIIGERAEHLVWIFSNAKRPFCWLFGENIPMTDGSFARVDRDTLHDLHMIEGANLLEQQGGLVEILSFASMQSPEELRGER
jgi:hypothetical protein